MEIQDLGKERAALEPIRISILPQAPFLIHRSTRALALAMIFASVQLNQSAETS